MKLLKRLLLFAAAIVVVLVAIGFALPASYNVKRNIVIQAAPKDIYPYISAFRKWPEWIVWTTEKYPDMTVTFGQTDTGVGAGYSWTGKSSGTGKIHFTKLDPDRLIGYALDFENGRYLSAGEITLVPEGPGVKVTWTNGGDLGSNPVNRWFGLLMDRMMGPDLAGGLARLKTKVESTRPQASSARAP